MFYQGVQEVALMEELFPKNVKSIEPELWGDANGGRNIGRRWWVNDEGTSVGGRDRREEHKNLEGKVGGRRLTTTKC